MRLRLPEGLQQVEQAVRVDGGLQVSEDLRGAAAKRRHEPPLLVLGANVRLALLHGGVGPGLLARRGGRGLHDPVEGIVGHDPGHEQLRRAHVIERQALDLGDVHAHLAVDAGALDAHDDAEVRRQPRGV